jgi:hypothetical protein
MLFAKHVSLLRESQLFLLVALQETTDTLQLIASLKKTEALSQ